MPSLQSDLDLSDGQMGIVLGAWQFGFIIASVPAGLAVDRIGVRRALATSILIMLASGVARSAAEGFWTLFLAVALFGLGAPITSIASPKIAAALFDDRDRRRAVGTYATAPVVGSALGLILPVNVIGPQVGGNWRTITLILSASAVVSLAIWLLVSSELDQSMTPGGGTSLSEYGAIAGLPVVRFVLVLAVLNFVVVHGIGQWLVGILVGFGWTAGQAGSLAALGMAGSLAATFVIPRLARPERRRTLMVLVLTVGALAISALQSTNQVILVPALLLGGGARSVMMPLLLMILMDHASVGPSRIAAATGLYLAVAQLGGVAGPTLTGFLADSSGGFAVPLIAHSGATLATAALIIVGYQRAMASQG